MSRSRRVKKEVERMVRDLLERELEKLTRGKAEAEENGEKVLEAKSKGGAVKGPSAKGYGTKYRSEFCEMVMEFAEQGKNLKEFAGANRISLNSIERWAKRYPEFHEAVEIAKLKHEAYWWDLARRHMNEKFNYHLFLFVMVNLHEYSNPDIHINFIEKQQTNSGIVIMPEVKKMNEILREEEDERKARNKWDGEISCRSMEAEYTEEEDKDEKGERGNLEAAEDPGETA